MHKIRWGSGETITDLLIQAFGGVTFCSATTDQKLALTECVAFMMRESDYSLSEAIVVLTPSVRMPDTLRYSKKRLQNVQEGLTLLALLYGAVNRDVSRVPVEDEI